MLEKIAAIFSIGWKKWRKQMTTIFFALFISIVGISAITNSTPVYAAPDTPAPSPSSEAAPNPDNTTPESPPEEEETEESTSSSSTDSNCNDQLGAIGWFVCPTTGAIAQAIDYIYGLIIDFIKVSPLSTDSESATYLVWEYAKSITNIVFVIAILIIIISQVTGFGIASYGIQKALPRIIVTAILVNLSFIICTLAVDLSNVLGYSVHNFFNSIANSIGGADIGNLASTSWSTIIGTIIGGGAVAGVAGITIAGSTGALIWMVVPAVIGAIIAAIAAFFTLVARQAIITLLVMISPLAFVAYLLPNTESLFKKWRDLLMKMLVFFPMFSLLFGASALAGWAIIATSGGSGPMLILGMVVQIFPLIFAPTLLKMSGTILGKVNEAVRKPFAPAQKALGDYTAERRARSAAMNMRDNKTLSGSIRNSLAYSKYKRADETKMAQEDTALAHTEKLNNQKLGRRIIGYRADGSAIYSTPQVNKDMYREFAHRELQLRSNNVAQEVEEKMGIMGDYLEENNMDTSRGTGAKLDTLSKRQGQNYLDSMAIKNAIARNDVADKRFYHESVTKANELGKDSEAYKRLILRGAGADGAYTGTDPEKVKQRNDAQTAVIADAFQMFEAEREAVVKKYTTFYTRQVTQKVLDNYDSVLDDKNIDAIVAAQNVLAFRGDHDAIGTRLQNKMNQDGWLQLDTDFANTLASNLLPMKDKDPLLGRLGKYINMETWQYTSGARAPRELTMDEFITGIRPDGETANTGNLTALLAGTSLTGIERNAFKNIQSIIRNSSATNKDQIEKEAMSTIMPQLISGIPSYESGSEQIRNAMAFITGLKYKGKDSSGKDVWDGSPSANNISATESYLKSQTSNDLLKFKTDAYNSIISMFAKTLGSEDAAKNHFREIQEQNGNLDVLRGADKNVLTTMKKGIRENLGL